MRVIRSITALQRLVLQVRRAGRRIGLVPTMGYLHDGHLSLVRRARRAVGPGGLVVVSIYVNPTQFGPKEDLSRYPRDFARDARRCRAAGVDVIFAPTNRQMYPAGNAERFSTFVVEETLSRGMEGAARPTHFRGVATVVAKLFNPRATRRGRVRCEGLAAGVGRSPDGAGPQLPVAPHRRPDHP